MGAYSGTPYSAAEINTVKNFLSLGGTLGIVAEPVSEPYFSSINQFLNDLGTSFSLVGSHTLDSGSATVLPTILTAGVSDYFINTFNEISGGTAAIQLNGRTVVAFESTLPNHVPEPSIIFLLSIGVLGLGLGFVQRKHA